MRQCSGVNAHGQRERKPLKKYNIIFQKEEHRTQKARHKRKIAQGQRGQRKRGTLPTLGFEGGQVPFHVTAPMEPYYKGYQYVHVVICLGLVLT